MKIFHIVKYTKNYLTVRKKTYKKNVKFSKIVREQMQKMGFKLVVEPGYESSTVIAFYTQKNSELNKLLQSKYGVKLGGGHADWKGNSLRFCTMGDLDEAKIMQGLDALKKAKKELGI